MVLFADARVSLFPSIAVTAVTVANLFIVRLLASMQELHAEGKKQVRHDLHRS